MNPNLIIIKKGHFRFFSQRKTTRENFKLWINTTYILSLLFIWILWIYYVWTLNINATKWYNIRNLELLKYNLTLEKELLEVKIAEYESLSTLIKWEWWNDMQKIINPEFLVVKDIQNYAFKN
jgi:hypothetical protein